MAITKVTTDVITDLAVTAPKLAADSVITAKIADNAVTAAKIAAGALGDQVAGITSSASATTIAGTLTSTGAITGTLATAAQTNITSLGTLTGLTIEAATARSYITSTGAGNNVALVLQADSADTTAENGGIYYVASDTADSSYLALSGDNANYHLSVTHGGKVGIGTASPEYEFEVKASTDASINIRAGTSSGDFAGLYFGDTDYPAEGRITYQNSDNKMRFWSDRQHVMTLDDNARVGIGTASPDSPLEISSSDDTRMKITDTGDSSELMLRSDGANTQIYTNTAHDLGIYTSGNVGQLFLKQSNGNVGIGATPSNAKLEVVATSGEVLRADSNGGAYRLVATQTGVNIQGVLDVLGTTLIHGVSNYTGLEVKGTGASRPAIQLSNANQGDLAMLYGTEGNALVIATNTNNSPAITIDSSQRINMPGQPCFSAALPAVTNGGNVIVWGGEHLDVGGHFNTSNGKFTAPVAGNYYFAFWILLDPANPANYSRVLFRKNGGASTQWTDNLESTDVQSTQAYHSVGGSCVMPLAANDYVETYNDGQNPTYGTAYGNWSGFLVS